MNVSNNKNYKPTHPSPAPYPRAIARVQVLTSIDITAPAANDGQINAADANLVATQLLDTAAAPAGYDCTGDAALDVRDVVCIMNKIRATATPYHYDPNGNLTQGGGRSLTYTAFNKPETIDYNGTTVVLGYGIDHQRLTKTVTNGTQTTVTTYIAGLYEKQDTGASVTHTDYIHADGQLIALVTQPEGSPRTYTYLHTDHLGSLDTLTGETGAVIKRLSYDPWGQRRLDTWDAHTGPLDPLLTNLTDRGYTGHAMDDEVGLVNMQARLYDPLLGRFVQPDTIIPDIFEPQSLNRYSYVLNNPLSYTDPTGHGFKYVGGGNQFDSDTGSWKLKDGWNYNGRTEVWTQTAQPSPSNTIADHYTSNNVLPPQSQYGNRPAVVFTGHDAGPCPMSCHRNGAPERSTYYDGADASRQLAKNWNTVAGAGAVIATEGAVLYLMPAAAPMLTLEELATSDGPVSGRMGASNVANKLTTEVDKAMFWSGVGRGGDTIAANVATQQGRVTLETTLAARGIKLPAWDPTNPASVAAWRQASHDFAAGASGHVRVLQGDAVRVNSVWAEVEFPALKASPNVKSITSIDATTGAEVLLWSR